MKPLIVINLKCYRHGERAIEIAKICKELKDGIIIAAQYADIERVARIYDEVYAQHVDLVERLESTGYVHAEAVREAGAKGTILNHAEHRIEIKELGKIIKECRRSELKTLICSPSLEMTKKIIRLRPDYVAFEDPKLISTGKSISKLRAEDVKKFAKLFNGTRIKPLCGAGISTGEDVRKAMELGCKGVLVASAVAKSKNPKKILAEMIRGEK